MYYKKQKATLCSIGGRKLHRYSGLIKCAECGSHFVAKTRTWRGKEYVEYACNSYHRYGKEYCTPHRIHQSQLDELVFQKIQNLRERIVVESEKYERILKQWLKQKPTYELQIRQYEDKIIALKQQVEDLIMGKVTDKSRTEFYNSMIEMNGDFGDSTIIIFEPAFEPITQKNNSGGQIAHR